ncbi:coatomer subunit epsilon-like [Eupeodes corollae]|uniref:coatomer subunit epsilon-like n=1 Tax=Eupeodes corollae TaxID=290404 RepID=UPI002492B907|nr:coatomer subunit epsilon-like [Eupeodes corollae]
MIIPNEDDCNSTLFYARNEYYVGNFMGSINVVLPEQSSGNSELLSYMYLSYLAIDSGRLILSDIKENNSTPLLALRYVHEAIENPTKIEEILQIINEKCCADEDETNIWHLAAAIIYCHDDQFENALKILHGSDKLESLALSIQCLLALNRVDLAKQLLSKMQQTSDDATLTQLAQAWIAISTGTEQMQDAFHIFQEFCEKNQPTPMLLNGQAICHLGQEHYEEAESVLREVQTKKHNDYDSLVNMMVLSHLNGKGNEVLARHLEQLKQFYPKSDCISELEKKSMEFDRLCLQYSPSAENVSS